MPGRDETSGIVLILAPRGKDAERAGRALSGSGIANHVCGDLSDVTSRFDAGTDAIILAEEALLPQKLLTFLEVLRHQPPWSDVPVIILTTPGGGERAGVPALEIFGPAANVTLLERPLSSVTLIAATKVALRARRRQREVRDLLQQRETILSSISDAFSAIDSEWRYTFVNEKVAELSGVPKEQLIGRKIWDVVPTAVGGEFYQRCFEVRETKQPQHFEGYYEPWGRWLATNIYSSGDGLVVLREDITQRRRQEEQLRRSEDRLRELEQRSRLAVEAADVGTFDYFPATGELVWSKRCNELFGLPPDAVVRYEDYLNGIHPDDRHVIDETVTSVGSTGSTGRYDIEYRCIGKSDGVTRWLSEKGRALFDETGKVTRFMGAILDITDRKESEQALRKSALQLRFVTDHAASVLIAQFDRSERILFANEPYAAFFGKKATEVVGRTIVEVIGQEAYAVVSRQIAKALEGTQVDFETEVPYPTGRRWMAITYVPEVDAAGELRSFVAVLQDTTDRKMAQLALERAKREAEEANRAKDQFLAMLSHELRTPLTPVLMTLAVLRRDGSISNSVREDLEVLQRNVELEALLIDDLLDLTRIAHGKFELNHEAVDIHSAIEHALEISKPDLSKKNLTIQADLQAREHHCWADAARLQQVFWNLLKNAIKFTPGGGLVEVRTRNDQDHYIIIQVADNGIGIDPAVQPRIFDAFEQGGRSVTSKFGGLGLGLAISKRVIDLHHGTIAVESAGQNRGATFSIKLKAMETSLLEGPAHLLDFDAIAAGPAEILLVEDHTDTARVMTRILQSAGYSVVHAGGVTEACKVAGERRFDLVISDVGLPDGTGLDLMRVLKKQHGLRGIALSGFGTEEDVAASRQAGFSEHLIKPIEWDRLRDAITRVLAEPEKLKTKRSAPPRAKS